MTFVSKLALALCRWTAAAVWSGGLLFAFQLVLQGAAQLDVEGLAKQPETAEELRNRLQVVFALLSAGFCGSLVFQTCGVFLGRRGRPFLFRVRKALFEGLVFWGGASLFFCLLILTASTQARWDVAGAYYWLAGGAGAMTVLLLAAAGFFANDQRGSPTDARDARA